jgi:hypothetical protein
VTAHAAAATRAHESHLASCRHESVGKEARNDVRLQQTGLRSRQCRLHKEGCAVAQYYQAILASDGAAPWRVEAQGSSTVLTHNQYVVAIVEQKPHRSRCISQPS